MTTSTITWIPDDDPLMAEAAKQAQANFRFFWREAFWEQRRVVPSCDLIAVKSPFTETVEPGFFGRLLGKKPRQNVEHMWVGDVDFDGRLIRGTLINTPNELSAYQEGDSVEIPMDRVSDWMYAIDGHVYGGWTVQALRLRMSAGERAEHDAVWDLDFGDPRELAIAPGWALGPEPTADTESEHPASQNLAEALGDGRQPPPPVEPDPSGWTLLHHFALSGSLSVVRVLLDAGADPHARTPDGRTAQDLARAIGWMDVAQLLGERDAG